MNLSSLGIFRSLRSTGKQFAVIGLGRFGRAVCETLHRTGYEVMGVDAEEKSVTQVMADQITDHTLMLDSTDPSALKQAGILELDTVIVAIGKYVEQSVITTLNLKEGGVPFVVAKASSEVHDKLLRKVGADLVIFPEHEMGCTLAKSLIQPNILERLDLDPNNSVVEMIIPPELDGKTIAEVQLRNRYGLTLIAIGQNNKLEVNPQSDRKLTQGALMVVVGSNKDIERFCKLQPKSNDTGNRLNEWNLGGWY